MLERFRDDFGLPEQKLIYLDYGFHLGRLKGKERVKGDPFTFGYIGRTYQQREWTISSKPLAGFQAIPASHLGRDRGAETEGLKELASGLPGSAGKRIEWMGEYSNPEIVPEVFNRCDAIVVPSIWAENSPLVIHEALQAGVPVVTANYGGMSEYVRHEENGLLFTHREPDSLTIQMQRLADDPRLAEQLSKRGYLQSSDGNVPGMMEHSRAVEDLYVSVIRGRRKE